MANNNSIPESIDANLAKRNGENTYTKGRNVFESDPLDPSFILKNKTGVVPKRLPKGSMYPLNGELFFFDGTTSQTIATNEYVDAAFGGTIDPDITEGSANAARSGAVFFELTKKIDFEVGVNKFNKETTSDGFYVNKNTGELIASAGLSASDYILIKGSTDYYCSNIGNDFLAYYDSDKTYISGGGSGSVGSFGFTSPSNAVYVRVTLTTSNKDVCQVEEGISASAYKEYAESIPSQYIQDIATKQDIDYFVEPEVGKNKFNKSTVLPDSYVRGANGAIGSLVGFNASDYIRVEASTNYYISNAGTAYYAIYDANKDYITGSESGDSSYTFNTPSNAAFVRISVTDAKLDTCQMEVGTSATAYESYSNAFNESYIPKSVKNMNQYTGKKLMQYGDSITANDIYYMDEVVDIVQPSSYVNKGVSGNTSAQVLARLEADLVSDPTLLDDVDLLSIFVGTNDYNTNVILGSISDAPDVDTTYFARMMKILKVVFTAKPLQKVFMITPLRRAGGTYPAYGQVNGNGNTIDDFAQAVIDVSEKYAVSFLDFNKRSGWNEETISSVSDDGIHPNATAGTNLAELQARFINTL